MPKPTTFILPDLPWAVLLDVIARDARPGDVIEVHTEAMRQLVEQRLGEVGRHDITVRLTDPATRFGQPASAPPGR